MAEGISEFPKEKQDYLVDSDNLPDVPGALDSSSSKEEHSSELVSKYQVKAKEPSVSLNLNETAPSEDCKKTEIETEPKVTNCSDKNIEEKIVNNDMPCEGSKAHGYIRKHRNDGNTISELAEVPLDVKNH